MSTQYIVKFNTTNPSNEKDIDGFVELIKSKNDIPIIMVRTHKDKEDIMNETLLYKFMTNNFAEVVFNDISTYCILNCKDSYSSSLISYMIFFDSSSGSAYNDFKKTFTEMYNTKYETEYYPSGREMYIGEVLYHKDSTGVVIERIPNGVGTMYYDMPSHMIRYTGEFENGIYDGKGIFYNRDNKIMLTANNISSGIPIGNVKLNINYSKKKETINIDFNDIWKKYNISDKLIRKQVVLSDDFVIDLAKLYWTADEMTMEAIIFHDKSLDDKYFELWNLMCQNTNKLDNLEETFNNITNDQTTQLYKYIRTIYICLMAVVVFCSIF